MIESISCGTIIDIKKHKKTSGKVCERTDFTAVLTMVLKNILIKVL